MNNTFKVGDGVTVHRYSDANAFTVIAVTAKTITIQQDTAKLLNSCTSGEPDALTFTPGGFCGHTDGTQRYSYERNEKGAVLVARLLKKPYMRWTKDAGEEYAPGLRAYGYVAEPAWATQGQAVTAGRREHYDFNF